MKDKIESNQDWKPAVGKPGWAFNKGEIQEFMVDAESGGGGFLLSNSMTVKPTICLEANLFPTAEAALASIKVYDLEGKEVSLARDRVVEQVKAVSEDYIYECPVCQNLDGLANFCDNCGVQFGENPVGGYPHQHEVIVVDRRDNGC